MSNGDIKLDKSAIAENHFQLGFVNYTSRRQIAEALVPVLLDEGLIPTLPYLP